MNLAVVDKDGRNVEVGETSELKLARESGLDVTNLLLLLPRPTGRLLPVGEVGGVDILPADEEGNTTDAPLVELGRGSLDDLGDLDLPVGVGHVVSRLEGADRDVEDVVHRGVLAVALGELFGSLR